MTECESPFTICQHFTYQLILCRSQKISRDRIILSNLTEGFYCFKVIENEIIKKLTLTQVSSYTRLPQSIQDVFILFRWRTFRVLDQVTARESSVRNRSKSLVYNSNYLINMIKFPSVETIPQLLFSERYLFSSLFVR